MNDVNIKHSEIISWAKLAMKNHGYDIQLAEEIVFVYDALAQYRLRIACEEKKRISFMHGRLSNTLKAFMLA